MEKESWSSCRAPPNPTHYTRHSTTPGHLRNARCPPTPLAALRAELSTAESRLAAERKAHAATRAAAAQRELDLEQQLAGGSGALADLQRQLEEAARKTRGGRGEGRGGERRGHNARLLGVCKEVDHTVRCSHLGGGVSG